MSDGIKEFSESFFRNLNCEISFSNGVMNISQVPEDFEIFFGKKAPYKLVFSPGIDTGAELMTKGSFLLKSMMNYLETKGQTTLIKLDFERNYKEEIEQYLKLRNCELHSLTKNEDYEMIIRYSFSTTLQYLNEKEQIMNSIFVKGDRIIDFNLEKYKQIEGKPEEIQAKELKAGYDAAKEHLKKLIGPRLTDAQMTLSEKMNREITRIKQHYGQRSQELETNIKKAKDQLIQLEKQREKLKEDEESFQIKKARLLETIAALENPANKDKLNQEENFFVNDEMHKYALNVHNKLINTSIIYYPLYKFNLFLKGKDSARQVEMTYDPLNDSLIKPIYCESCKRDISEIFICSSGHITCNNCYERCGECNGGICKNCVKKSCDYCARKLCKKCVIRCTLCWKDFCKTHTDKNYLSGKDGCYNCLKMCSMCKNYAEIKRIKKDSEDREVCEKCFRLKGLTSFRKV